MLKLKSISSIDTICNESDFYIKIKIIFGDRYESSPICYWSTFGAKKSLIEICLKKLHGAIYKITVVSAPIVYTQEAPEPNKNIITLIGLPLFETDAWEKEGDPSHYYSEEYVKGYYIRERNDFEIYTGEKKVTILFSHNEVVLHVINDSIIFGFDNQGFLCFIQMVGMRFNEEGFLENL